MSILMHMKERAASVYFAFIFFVIAVCGVISILLLTSPASLGATGMLLAFSVFYAFFFTIFLLIIHFVQLFFLKIKTRAKTDESDFKQLPKKMRLSRQYSIAVTLAFAPVIILALRSIGQLDAMSAGLVMIFEVIAIFYIIKR